MKKENRLVISNSKNNLVLGLNMDGEIVQFDIVCQQLTGYSRTEALNKKISDFLIPTSYITKWKELFDSVVKNEDVDDFEIPLKTSNGEEVLISWSSFPLENKSETVRNICFIGKNLEVKQHKKNAEAMRQDNNKNKMIHIYSDKKPVDIEMDDFEKRIATHPDKLDKIIKDRSKKHKKFNKISVKTEKKDERLVGKNRIIFKKDSKNIIFEKKPSTTSDTLSNVPKKVISLRFKKSATNSLESDAINKTVKDLSKKYENLSEKLKELEKKDRKLERKNKLLEKNLKNMKTNMQKKDEIKPSKKSKHEEAIPKLTEDKTLFKKWPKLLSDHFGTKKKQVDFELRIHALDERAKELGELEDQLLKERKIHDKRIAEFTAWKEKLVNLESEIEKRRADLIEQERTFRENLASSPVDDMDSDVVSHETEDVMMPEENVVQDDHHDVLDKIPQCAAVVQRGILKQINSSFAELIGFETDEIVDKDLFDFIAPGGLEDIEKYYLNRLKGEDVSTYDTIFLTKDDRRISVEINIKPVLHNGERADMVVIMDLSEGPETTTEDAEDEIETEKTEAVDEAKEEVKKVEGKAKITEETNKKTEKVEKTEETDVAEDNAEEDNKQ